MAIDSLDRGILETLRSQPRVSVLELARLVGAARNTVYARIERMERQGIITGFGPDLDVVALGYSVTAFTTIEVIQGRFGEVVVRLEQIPAVLEVHTIAGVGDLLCRVVARSNEELMERLEEILAIPGVDRTTTSIALARPIPYRPHVLLDGYPTE